MSPNVAQLHDLVFTHPITGEEYGPIRPFPPDEAPSVNHRHWRPIAEDSCGNAFVVHADGRVGFWGHETDEITLLAPDWEAFAQGCVEGTAVDFDPSKVISAWVNPSFAREHGIECDEEGWIKRPPEQDSSTDC